MYDINCPKKRYYYNSYTLSAEIYNSPKKYIGTFISSFESPKVIILTTGFPKKYHTMIRETIDCGNVKRVYCTRCHYALIFYKDNQDIFIHVLYS